MMTVTPAAADIIHSALKACAVASPVVYLGEVSSTPTIVENALRHGASEEAVRELALEALEVEPRYLYPLVYPRSRFLWLFTTTIYGVRFASPFFYPPEVRGALKSGTLDAAKRGLVLRDRNGIIVLPKRTLGENAL
jgi:hypothetical protein